MDGGPSRTTVGSLLLALALIGWGWRQPPVAVDLSVPASASAATAVALGAPIAPTEPDPAAWDELPGIGPARAAALAELAAAGALRCPDDLLQARGVGSKTSAAVAGRVAWDAAESLP